MKKLQINLQQILIDKRKIDKFRENNMYYDSLSKNNY